MLGPPISKRLVYFHVELDLWTVSFSKSVTHVAAKGDIGQGCYECPQETVRWLFNASRVRFLKCDDFPVLLAAVARTACLCFFLKRERIKLEQVRPDPWEDDNIWISRTQTGFPKHVLLLIFIQLRPFALQEILPILRSLNFSSR